MRRPVSTSSSVVLGVSSEALAWLERTLAQHSPSTVPTNPPPNPSASKPPSQPLAGAVSAALNPPQGLPFAISGTPPQAGAQFQQVSFQLQAPNSQFPPPEAVRIYEQILPGAFDRIIQMAEKAQKDQADSVTFANQSLRKDIARGQYLGAGISLAALGCGMWCVLLNQAVFAGIFVSVSVMGVARALIESVRAPKPNPAPPTQIPPA